MIFRREAGPGIEIRLFEMDDARTLYALVDQNRDYLRKWLPWVDRTLSPQDIREFIARANEKYEVSQAPEAAIWVDGVLGGSIGIHPIDWPNRSTSIGYWLDSSLQGRGVMTQCCSAMLDYLFGDLGLHRAEIRCATGNMKSCAIPQRLGFTREGVMREAEWVSHRWLDLVVWSVLESEWSKRSGSRARSWLGFRKRA